MTSISFTIARASRPIFGISDGGHGIHVRVIDVVRLHDAMNINMNFGIVYPYIVNAVVSDRFGLEIQTIAQLHFLEALGKLDVLLYIRIPGTSLVCRKASYNLDVSHKSTHARPGNHIDPSHDPRFRHIKIEVTCLCPSVSYVSRRVVGDVFICKHDFLYLYLLYIRHL